MSNTAQSQMAEARKSIQKLHDDAYAKFPVNSAFPVGCDERAEFMNRGMADIKKRFPKAFR